MLTLNDVDTWSMLVNVLANGNILVKFCLRNGVVVDSPVIVGKVKELPGMVEGLVSESVVVDVPVEDGGGGEGGRSLSGEVGARGFLGDEKGRPARDSVLEGRHIYHYTTARLYLITDINQRIPMADNKLIAN